MIEATAKIGRRRTYVDGPREETSLLGFANVLLRHRRLIVLTALIGGAILGTTSLNSPRMYTAYAAFTVRGVRPPSQLSAVAERLGLTLGSNDQSQSVVFYGDLVTSRAILTPVSRKAYTVSAREGTHEGSLASFFGIDDANPGLAAERTIDELGTRLSVTTTPRTGVISVVVRAERPQLAQQILQNIVKELDTYNLALRRARAVAEREFTEKRLAEASGALTRAEGQLSTFLQLNRDYSSSPVLRLEHDRLQRAVRMRQQIYTGVAQSFEQARIEEIRDLPTVLVIDQPEARLTRQQPVALRRILLGLIVGIFAGIVLAFVRERVAETRDAGTTAYAEFAALKSDTLSGLARPWAPVGRLLKGQSRG